VTRLLWAAAVVVLVIVSAGCRAGGLGRDAQLFVVDVESGDRQQLTDGPRSYSSPSWSPDSRRLAVVASGPESGAIEVVDAEGTESRVVVDRRGFIQGVAWSPSASTLAYVRLREPASWTLETIESDGSGGCVLAAHQSDRVAIVGPSWAPDGTQVAYAGGDDTFAVPMSGARPRLLGNDAWAPSWSPNGRFVLLRTRDALIAAPVDGKRPVTIIGGLIDAHAAWSPTSSAIAFSGVTLAGDRHYYLNLVTVGSQRVRRLASEVVADAPAWSPDGRSLVFATWDGTIRAVTVASGEERTLTRLPNGEIRDLAWSPDGRRLAFAARHVTED
jgi:Tol biopolymer transport system component